MARTDFWKTRPISVIHRKKIFFRNMEYLALSGEDITGTATETDPRLYYYTKYPELFLVDASYCVQDG